MKRCSNPQCNSSFLYEESQMNCPYCHSPLENCAEGDPLLPPVGVPFEASKHNCSSPFITRHGNTLECTGRVTEIDHQALFEGKFQKLFNSLIKGIPYQLGPQSTGCTIRVEPITDELPGDVKDFCLYGDYNGRLQVGDEISLRAKDRGSFRMVKSIVNLTTGSHIKPGFQIPSQLIRSMLLTSLLVLGAILYAIINFFVSGAFTTLVSALLAAFMPILITLSGIWLIFRSVFPGRKERRRW